ncbi:MAG: hypothetical protein R3C53_02605 [Pirellulaceae bacterium]
MPIEFACENCKKLLRVPDGSGGLSCECPACRTLLEIPKPEEIHVVEEANASADISQASNKISIPCPKCTHELICSPALLGTRGQCKRCKYIFTISESSTDAEQSTGLIFTCPKCEQLFEGKEEMRGRKGKCHACGEVFRIELRPAESASSTDELPVQKTIKRSPATPKPSTAPRAKTSSPQPIQMVCSSCDGVMEVPAEAAGQTTACPYCQQLLHIPVSEKSNRAAAPRPRPTPPSPAPALAPSPAPQLTSSTYSQPAPLGPTTGAGGFPELGDMSGAINPYAAPPPSYPGYSQGGFQQAPRRSNRRSPVIYILPGVFVTILGIGVLLLIAFQTYNVVRQWQDLQNLPPEAKAIALLLVFGGISLGALQGFLQLFGGIAMIRRAGLSAARAGAIACCFPCLYCLGLNFPFGIWATVVCFSGSVKRDFDY